MTYLADLSTKLAEAGQAGEFGAPFSVKSYIEGSEILQIEVEDLEEFPIYISVSDEQILCFVYLFAKGEVAPDVTTQMNEAMLAANISVPLSAFAIINDQYVLFGALSVNSSFDDIVHEIMVLSHNSIDAIEAMSEYLV